MRQTMLAATIATLTVGFIGNAAAADMPVKAAPLAAHSWTGCHVGGNVGWIASRDRFDRTPSGTYLAVAGVPSPPNAGGGGLLAGDIALTTHSDTSTSSGITAGAQIGCDRQVNNLVYGIEADFNWSSLNSSISRSYPSVTSVNPLFGIGPESDNLTNRLDWFSTVRGRIGIARDRWLVFATGGLAIGHFKSNTNVSFGTHPVLLPVLSGAQHIGSGTATRLGLALGGGMEYALNNLWSIKAEYLYLNFGSFTYTSPLVAPAGVAAGYTWTTTVAPREHIVRVGANYNFRTQ